MPTSSCQLPKYPSKVDDATGSIYFCLALEDNVSGCRKVRRLILISLFKYYHQDYIFKCETCEEEQKKKNVFFCHSCKIRKNCHLIDHRVYKKISYFEA